LGANFWAADVKGNIFNGSADVATGSAYVGLGGFPFSFLAYFDVSYSLDIGSGQDFAGLDVKAAAGYIGTAYLRLEEHAPNGTLVATKSLKWALLNGFSWRASDQQQTGGLNYVVYNATDSASDVKVSISYLVSEVAGILNGDIPIVPRSLEAVISITGYPYADPSNTLSLVIGVGYGGANLTASGRTVRSAGSDVYFSLSDQVTVAGQKQGVQISGYETADVDAQTGNSDFLSQLQGKYSGSYSFNLVKVTFPAGADHIVYDPSAGNGQSVLDNAAGTLVASVAVLMVALVALLM